MAWISKERMRAQLRFQVRPSRVGSARFGMRFWGPSAALGLLLASSWAQDPSQQIKPSHRSSDGTIAQQTEDSEGEKSLVFPDYVDGGGWSVQLALSNVSADTDAEVVVEVYGQDGGPVVDLFDSGLTFEIPPLGSRVLRSSGAGAIRRGWIQVRTGMDAVGGLLTYKDEATGIEVSVEPAELGGRFALFVEESDDVGAGVAIFKPESSPSVQLRVRDEEGNDPLEGAFVSRGDFHQLARTLPEWFDAEAIDREFLTDFRGLLFLRTEDESPFAPLGLRFGKMNSSLSSVPVIRDEVHESTDTILYFPDYVDGSGWSVQLALSNVDSEETAEVRVEVFDEDGRTVRDLFDTEATVRIPSLGSRVLRSAGAGAIRRGWIAVQADSAAVSGLLTYRQAESGVEVSVKPVELGSQFALFVEESPAVGAGVAIFKPDASSNVELRIRDEAGNDPLAGTFIQRGDFRQLARTLPEWLGTGGVDTGFLKDFRGLLFLRSEDDSQFAPLGLRFGKTSASLSSVPAVRIIDGDPFAPPTVSLSVSPSSIDWGEGATLTWSSTNAVSAEITPDVGAVPVSGSQKVSPRATTTYRVTVRGGGGQTETASVTVRVVVSEQAALTALYEFTGGSDWTNRGNWGTNRPLGEWHGVSVDGQGRVTGLNLTNNGLAGAFPPELGALTHLTSLSLKDNALTGPIPPELGSLVRLTTLDLRNNSLTGTIPPEFGALRNLSFLALEDNELTGTIPAQIGSLPRLRILALGNNSLTGTIPPELGALANVTFFSFRSNLLTGPIPPELGSLRNVTNLNLSDNALTGSIPSDLGSLANLEQLSLSQNFFEGPIPSTLGSLLNLMHLRLSHNNLTGPIPPQLASLNNLATLDLNSNALASLIPPELGSLANLTYLDLSGNALTGPVPEELGSLAKLRVLGLRRNRLDGPLPDSLSTMDLVWFRLESNQGLCVPGDANFVAWSKGIENFPGGRFCNDSDRAALEAFFEIAGGPRWTNSDGWRSDRPLEEWYGVGVDSQGRVTTLDLSGNGLEGRVAGGLGSLSQMRDLRIGGNALSGRLPLSLSSLPSLEEFRYGNTELCIPIEESFQAWLGAIPSHEGTDLDCAPLTDREILLALYDAAGGPRWSNSENWLTDLPLEEWHGVSVDDEGRVIRLILTNNNLTGRIPAELGMLAELTRLDLEYNRLTGVIPAKLGALSKLNDLRLTSNELTGRIPAELGSLANLTNLNLIRNNLTGSIPPEFGSLAKLKFLWLGDNTLSGSIPPELGALSRLEVLLIEDNGMTGTVPAELGSLDHLRVLNLGDNNLTGSIPPELGSLAKLRTLRLDNNALSGSVPSELGGLTNLEVLWLQNNRLTGRVPPGFGGLENLRSMVVAKNSGMFGALPARVTNLGRLEELLAAGTNLCVPADAGFAKWLSGVLKHRVATCGSSVPPAVILVQAVQSREYPVPLVAGKEALLRVFVTSSRNTGSNLPPVRATFYRNGVRTHVMDIPGKPVPIPREIDEGDLRDSTTAQVPGSVVQPGLEMVIDVDPEATLGPDPGVTKRIPERGRLAVDVRTMPVFELTVVPFLWSQNPNSSIVEIADGMARDPGGHFMLKPTRALLPVNELDVMAHAPVSSSSNNAYALLNETQLIRTMEGASGYFVGMMAGEISGGVIGLGRRPGRDSFSIVHPETLAHELGHNLNLYHAPCGVLIDLDPAFPGKNGSIGDWGYDSIVPGRLLPPVWPDLMTYCRQTIRGIGAYNFTNALRYRLHTAGSGEGSALVAAPAKSLVLWGGVGSDGRPYLEPAFVVDAPAALPRSGGEFETVGRNGDGEELFSLSFTMPELADGDGRSSFAFALPVQPGWAEELASITLSGPGGSVRLDEETDRPVTILRDSGTGEIRGILRGRATASERVADSVSALGLEPGFEVLTSRGIPEMGDRSR